MYRALITALCLDSRPDRQMWCVLIITEATSSRSRNQINFGGETRFGIEASLRWSAGELCVPKT